MSRVTWRGQTFDARTRDMLAEVARISGPILIWPTQGSYNTSVSASAGTHAGGGAVDLMHPSWSVADYGRVVTLMRKVGFAAWHRTPQQSNWPRHCHGIAVQPGGRNDRGVLSAGAHGQVRAYFDGRNGLASGARDDGPRTYVGTTWEKYRKAQEGSMATQWFKYSGKPSGDLWLPYNKYRKLDAPIPAPPRKGIELRMCYLNVSPQWVLPKSDPMYWFQTAVIRVRWTRAGEKPDPTAYQTFTMTPWEKFLITHTHWEKGEANRGGWWSMRVRGHLQHGERAAKVGTRYSKGALP